MSKLWDEGRFLGTEEDIERLCTCRCLGCLVHWHSECEDPPCIEPPPDPNERLLTWSVFGFLDGDGNE